MFNIKQDIRIWALPSLSLSPTLRQAVHRIRHRDLLTLGKRIRLAALLEPEPVAKFEPLELVADETLERRTQKGVVHRALHQTAEEEVDVGYIAEQPLEAGHQL